jgi:hypothetical protein
VSSEVVKNSKASRISTDGWADLVSSKRQRTGELQSRVEC